MVDSWRLAASMRSSWSLPSFVAVSTTRLAVRRKLRRPFATTTPAALACLDQREQLAAPLVQQGGIGGIGDVLFLRRRIGHHTAPIEHSFLAPTAAGALLPRRASLPVPGAAAISSWSKRPATVWASLAWPAPTPPPHRSRRTSSSRGSHAGPARPAHPRGSTDA